MLQYNHLTVTYGKRTILNNISFTVKKGELTVIIGKNGSGKTTLLHALSSLVPYKGEILADAVPLSALTPALRAKMIAVMPQILPQPPITVRRLVAFGRQPFTGFSGVLSANDWEIVDEMLALTGLEALQESFVDKISGGERRKAFFAMMLAQKAPLLLADEPCANLDPEYSKYILSMLKSRKAAGDTILCVLHDINQAFEIADRLLVIDQGHLIFDGTPAQAASKHIPQDLFSLSAVTCCAQDGSTITLYQ